jgi:hypothetical protein
MFQGFSPEQLEGANRRILNESSNNGEISSIEEE